MNEVIDFPKFKNPKGKIKIELFDDLTGKKIEEVNSTNFIAKNITDFYFKSAMASLFTQKKYTDGVNLYENLGDPFKNIELTNAEHAELPDLEWYRKGDLIGYARTDSVYSGSDTLLGSYNSKESYTNVEKVHMVFDFPTHAANGTFSSIYFTKDKIPDLNFFKKPFSNEGRGVLHARKYNNEIWILHSSSAYSDASANRSNKLSKYDDAFNLLQTYTLPKSVLDFEIYESYIYFVDYSTNASIQKAPITDPANLSTVLASVPKIGTNTAYAAGIVFDVKTHQFVVSSSTSTSSGSVDSSILRYDANFNLLAKNDYTFTDGGYYYQKLLYTDLGDIFVNGYRGSYIVENEKAIKQAGTGLVMGIIDDNVVRRDGSVAPKIGISSRSLLDAPITKTETNTMKITYDFILPPIL